MKTEYEVRVLEINDQNSPSLLCHKANSLYLVVTGE